MTIKLIEQTLTSATRSDIGTPEPNKVSFEQRFLNFKISGLVDSTISIEASLDQGATWQASETFTADATKAILHASPGVLYSFNVTTYGTDTISVLLLN